MDEKVTLCDVLARYTVKPAKWDSVAVLSDDPLTSLADDIRHFRGLGGRPRLCEEVACGESHVQAAMEARFPLHQR